MDNEKAVPENWMEVFRMAVAGEVPESRSENFNKKIKGLQQRATCACSCLTCYFIWWYVRDIEQKVNYYAKIRKLHLRIRLLGEAPLVGCVDLNTRPATF